MTIVVLLVSFCTLNFQPVFFSTLNFQPVRRKTGDSYAINNAGLVFELEIRGIVHRFGYFVLTNVCKQRESM